MHVGVSTKWTTRINVDRWSGALWILIFRFGLHGTQALSFIPRTTFMFRMLIRHRGEKKSNARKFDGSTLYDYKFLYKLAYKILAINIFKEEGYSISGVYSQLSHNT